MLNLKGRWESIKFADKKLRVRVVEKSPRFDFLNSYTRGDNCKLLSFCFPNNNAFQIGCED